MPCSSTAAATASEPVSCQLTEARSGRTVQRRIASTRAAGSGSAQAPVVTPIGTNGDTKRTAVITASTVSASRVSSPSTSFGCRWMQSAPRLDRTDDVGGELDGGDGQGGVRGRRGARR